MQSGMKGTFLSVALYKTDFTITLVKQSQILNINLLAMEQKNLINRLGRKSGRDTDKFARLPHSFDERGCPYLTQAIGYIACEVHDTADSGDHELFCCRIIAQRILNPDKEVLTHRYLKEHGYIR
jgi:flavin reductase (DIM6/NTAB) family NADH-FMN oxidoreductase RutF